MVRPIKQTYWSKPYKVYVHLNGTEEVLDKFIRALIRSANTMDRRAWGQLKAQGIKLRSRLHNRMRESLKIILTQEDLPKDPGHRHYCVLGNTDQFLRDLPHLAEEIIKLATAQGIGCRVIVGIDIGYSSCVSADNAWYRRTMAFTSYQNKYYQGVRTRLGIYLHRTHCVLPDQQFTTDTQGDCTCSTLPCVASTAKNNS